MTISMVISRSASSSARPSGAMPTGSPARASCSMARTVDARRQQRPNALHGGLQGFDRKLWRIVELSDDPGPTLVLERESPHGEEGYPGNLATRVTYRVRSAMELSVTYEATTDRPTCPQSDQSQLLQSRRRARRTRRSSITG